MLPCPRCSMIRFVNGNLAVGREYLFADLRQFPPVKWAGRRSLWSAQALYGWADAVLPGLSGRGTGAIGPLVYRHSWHPGSGGGPGRPDHALTHHHAV